MNVGMIVYSQTGNTLSVAEKVKEALLAAGHATTLARVEVTGEGMQAKLTVLPEILPYDALIFAAPVQAFSLAAPMMQVLSQMPDIRGKQVYAFVTQHFKKAWLGGNRALKQLASACKAKGADILWSSVVNWSSPQKDTQISDIVNKLSVM